MDKYLGVIDRIFFIHCTNIPLRYKVTRFAMNRLEMNGYSEIRYTTLFPPYKDLKYYDEITKTNYIPLDKVEDIIIGAMGCLIEQYKTIKQAYNRGFERIMICEDDLRVRTENEQIFMNAIKNLPQDANIIKCNSIVYQTYDIVNTKYGDLEEYDENYFKYKALQFNYYGSICMIYDRKGMEFFLDIMNKYLVEFDVYMTNTMYDIDNDIHNAIVNGDINMYHMKNNYIFKVFDKGNIDYTFRI